MSDQQEDLAAFEAWAKSMRFDDWDETFEECYLAGIAHARAESRPGLESVHPDDVEEGALGLALFKGSYLVPVQRVAWGWRHVYWGHPKDGLVVAVDIVAFFPCDVRAMLASRPEKGEPHRTLPDMIDEERSEGRDDWRASEEEIARLARQTDDRSAMRVYDARHCVRWAEDRAASVIEGLREKLAAAEKERDDERGWNACRRIVDDLITRSLEPVRAKRSTGEPIDNNGRAVQRVVQRMLLAEKRAEEAEATASCRDATLAMAVARLGGQVEGKPTQRSNFLQRIDALREAEAERDEHRTQLAEIATALGKPKTSAASPQSMLQAVDKLRTFKTALEEIQRKTRNLSDGSSHLIGMVCDKHGLSAEPSTPPEPDDFVSLAVRTFHEPGPKPPEPAVELAAGQVWEFDDCTRWVILGVEGGMPCLRYIQLLNGNAWVEALSGPLSVPMGQLLDARLVAGPGAEEVGRG